MRGKCGGRAEDLGDEILKVGILQRDVVVNDDLADHDTVTELLGQTTGVDTCEGGDALRLEVDELGEGEEG